MRWNPAISSFTLSDYATILRDFPRGVCYNWSIFEHEQAHEGDRFYMMRVGDDAKAGLVFRGYFQSDPYAGKDWAGSSHPRFYCDIACFDFAPNPDSPHVSQASLAAAMPGVEWGRGHSGVVLTPQQAQLFDRLWDESADSDDDDTVIAD